MSGKQMQFATVTLWSTLSGRQIKAVGIFDAWCIGDLAAGRIANSDRAVTVKVYAAKAL